MRDWNGLEFAHSCGRGALATLLSKSAAGAPRLHSIVNLLLSQMDFRE
jgi:hypothetical protein